MNTETRPCPHCAAEPNFLTREKVASLVNEIPLSSSMAAADELLQKRLDACNVCDALREEVLCSHCGCFILFRARVDRSNCPHPAGDKWNFLWQEQNA